MNPACNLVPDILIEIFQRLRSVCVASNPASLEWTRVAGVCQQWRAVAHATPGLWRRIPIHNVPQFLHFAELSQHALLEIAGSLRLNGDIRSGVYSVMHRIQKLQLTIAPDDFKEFSEAGKLGNTNSIREIDIDCGEYPLEIHADDCWWYSSPNLQSLAFTSRKGVSLSDMPRLPGLRHLKLVQTNRVARPASEINSMLRKLPALESLHLEGLLPNTVSQAETQNPLTLPLLKLLSLGGTPQRCSNFLLCVCPPGLEYLNFVGCVLTSHGGLPLLVQTLCNYIRNRPRPIEFQSLQYEEGDNCHKTTLSLWTTHDDPDVMPPPGAFYLRLVVLHDHYASSVRTLCSTLPVESVQNLHVHVGDTRAFGSSEGTLSDIARWKTAFEKLKEVRRVSISGFFPYELLNGLCGTSDTDNGGLMKWLYGPTGTPPFVGPPHIKEPPAGVVRIVALGSGRYISEEEFDDLPADFFNADNPIPHWLLDPDTAVAGPSGGTDEEHDTPGDPGTTPPPPHDSPTYANFFIPTYEGLYDFEDHEEDFEDGEGYENYESEDEEEDSEPEDLHDLPKPPPCSPPTPQPTRLTPDAWKSGFFEHFDYEHFKAQHLHVLRPGTDTMGKRMAQPVPDPSTIRRTQSWHDSVYGRLQTIRPPPPAAFTAWLARTGHNHAI